MLNCQSGVGHYQFTYTWASMAFPAQELVGFGQVMLHEDKLQTSGFKCS